jgi:hypothetical protein
MSWVPAQQSRFIETPLLNMKKIAARDHEAVIEYYNDQPDAGDVVLTPFKRITNTRYYELFFSERFEEFPVLVIGPDSAAPNWGGMLFNGVYNILCEVWVVGSNADLVKLTGARFATAITQMYIKAGLANPADFIESAAITENSGIDLAPGEHKYQPIITMGPNAYKDVVRIPFKLSYLEV